MEDHGRGSNCKQTSQSEKKDDLIQGFEYTTGASGCHFELPEPSQQVMASSHLGERLVISASEANRLLPQHKMRGL